MARQATRGAAIWSRLLARSVCLFVERTRREVFGNPDPPFRRYRDALTWLLDQDRKARKSRTVNKTLNTARGQLLKNLNFRLTDDYLPALEILTKDGDRVRLLALRNDLARLRPHVLRLCRDTGWSEPRAVSHLLTGGIPFLKEPPFAWRGPAGGIPHVTVTLWPWMLTRSGMERLRQDLRRVVTEEMREVWREGTREASDEDLLLLDLMRKAGPPPEPRQGEGRVNYWKRLAKRWREVTDKQATWDTLRKRWERIRRDHRALADTITREQSSDKTADEDRGAAGT